MKRIYLIRHALPEFPEGKSVCLGITDLPLGQTGLLQAQAMAEKLPAVDAVYSSPLSRCIQTAQTLGMPVTAVENLREMSVGIWDGLSFDTIRQRYPELYAARGKNPDLLPPGAEPRQEGLDRFRQAMDAIASADSGDCAVIAHGGIISAFLEAISGTRYKPGYTEVIPLIWENGCFSVSVQQNHI